MVSRPFFKLVLSYVLFLLPTSAVEASSLLASSSQGATLPGAPDYDWWDGCSPTSAGMMMGYYDIHGYDGLSYNNLVQGGTAELSTFGNSGALANSAIASQGHVNQFWGTSEPGVTHTMTWGGSYSGLEMWGVTGFTPAGGNSPVPEPATLLLFGAGLIALANAQKRRTTQ